LTTLMSLDPMRVVFDMDERSFLRYRRLMRAGQVKGPGGPIYLALADEDGFPHQGELDSIDNVVEPRTSTVRARGVVPNRDRLLVPGASVRVKVPLGKRRRVLEVPESTVGKAGGKHFIWVINGRKGIQRREVTLGEPDGDWRVIEKGLRYDDWVVVDRRARPGSGPP
jgi:RND family efflux transporter MFP subunit